MMHTLRKTPTLLSALLLFLGPVFGSANPSFAQETTSSEDTDPYAFTQDYEPRPAMWRLADDDTTIYLLGTIHLLPEGFEWRYPELDEIVASADELVVETVDEQAEKDMMERSAKIETIFSARKPISEQLPARLHGKWRQFAAQLGQDYATLDRAPILVGMLGFMMSGPEDDPSSYVYGVETVLEAEFRETDRPIYSIENFSDILLSLYRRSDSQAVRDLATELDRWNGKGAIFPGLEVDEEADFWEMEHMWARGELDDDFDLGFGQGKLGARFRKVLLEDRNRAWAGWLEERLAKPGKVLVAVGAGHFEGHDSVLVMLEERGLSAERVH